MNSSLPLRRSAAAFFLALVLFSSGCARTPRRVTPPMMPSAPAAVAPSGFYHTVQRSETLYRIAKNYDMDWHDLMAINNVSHPSMLEVGQRLYIPHKPVFAPFVSTGPLDKAQIQNLIGPKRYGYDWKTITLHHSGTLKGGAQAFNRNHQQRKMGGLFYHFVIGNGSNTANGALEVGWRWTKQVKANRPNDIQICLVGDFNRQYVSDEQFNTLINLIQSLREEYGIPLEGIRKHEDIKGKRTECPGKRFPFSRITGQLRTQGP